MSQWEFSRVRLTSLSFLSCTAAVGEHTVRDLWPPGTRWLEVTTPVLSGWAQQSATMPVMGTDRRWGWAFGFGCVVLLLLAVGLGWRGLRVTSVGQVDPLSAVLASLALALALWSGNLSLQAFHWQSTDPLYWAPRLANKVANMEGRELARLIGRNMRTIDIDFVLRPTPGCDAEGALHAGTLNDVVSYYRTLRSRRLIITGAPGAGKTVLLVTLISGLLADRKDTDPIPVRLSASSWDSRRPIGGWLVEHLTQTYGLRRRTAAALVEARLITPVLDGLDEMDRDPSPESESRAVLALEALNAFQSAQGSPGLVVTCRTEHHRALETVTMAMEDAASVEIQAVTTDKTLTFVESQVGRHGIARWQHVLDAIDFHPDGALARSLATPWRLNLAVTVYQEYGPRTYIRDPSDLLRPELDDEDKIRDHLLSLFIPAAVKAGREGRKTAYTPRRVHMWLATLAGYLGDNEATSRSVGGRLLPGTDIVLHELWPLAGRRPRYVTLAAVAVIWLTGGSIMLLQAPDRMSWQYLGALSVAAVSAVAMLSVNWAQIWPKPARIDLFQAGCGWILSWLAVCGLVGTAVLIRAVGWAVLAVALPLTLSFLGLISTALRNGPVVEENVDYVADPRKLISHSLWLGIASAFTMGCTLALIMREALAPGFVLACALTMGAGFGISAGLAGVRHLALLMSTRGRLPTGLGRFLWWCHQAGLLRAAGVAYQFRHHELQEYLARTPEPSS
ncbi:NACHT domain-containing protein [Streptomyces sp. NPDC050759]|uniref:NACHT domain-containing protein n=1 Tax=Streptomyces sp. NPDC050759 TaxID=3365635 RepID=UPI00379DC8E1